MTEVTIFFSGTTESDLLEFYQNALDFLKAKKIRVSIVDVDEKPAVARKNHIVATPYVLIKQGSQIQRIFGIVQGIKQFLASDVQGQSMMHMYSFKQGREYGAANTTTSKSAVNKRLETTLKEFHVQKVMLLDFQRKKGIVTVALDYDNHQHDDIELRAFLGGFFTEVCGKGIHFTITKRTKDSTIFSSL